MNKIRQAFILWKQERGKNGTPLQRRLFAFFASMAVLLITVFAALLVAFNINGEGTEALRKYMDSELSHVHSEVANDFGRLALQGLAFAEAASLSAESFFDANEMSADTLNSHPELIEPFLDEQTGNMLNLIHNASCSGIFIMLDATVNPDDEDAEYARAGMFLRKTFPNAAQLVSSKVFCLRGPAEVARNNSIELLGQWRMEYDMRTDGFLEHPIEVARSNPELPLSRLYFWTERIVLDGNSESAFLLCVPLRTQDGVVYGICGFEISDRMFKLLYTPGTNSYSGAFTTVAPLEDATVHIERGMIAGSNYLTSATFLQPLAAQLNTNGFYSYISDSVSFSGVHAALKIYPSGSPYENQVWVASIMMPEETFIIETSGNNPYLLFIILALLVISLVASIAISRRYIKPVTDALDKIKSKEYSKAPNTPYIEINDLMEFLAQQEEEKDAQNATDSQAAINTVPMFEEFLKNIQTLSPAENNVFSLYIKGYKAQEIADELVLSINTIKTHNRHIFAKLNVSTRKELLVYIDMMKELKLIKDE